MIHIPDSLSAFLPRGWPEVNLLIAFGVLLAFGTLGGMLAARLRWLPTITGFMAFGLIIGPSGLRLLSPNELESARPLVEVALGLILYKLGTSLHPWQVLRNRSLVVTSLVESGLTFAVILALMLWVGARPLVAMIAAAIAVSSSPAVLIHVAEELKAVGPTIAEAQALVAMNNVLAFVLFSFALPMALHSVRIELTTAVLVPAYQLLGALAVSMVVAWIVTRIASRTKPEEQHFRFALVVGAVMLSLGLAVALKVSTLFTALTLGVACRWMEGQSRLTRMEFGGGGDVFFIILFVFAGASLHLDNVLEYAPMAAAYVAARTIAKCVSVYACGRAFGQKHQQSLAAGLLLIPMAGLAIGLVQTTSGLLPELGAQVSTVVLAAVVIFETVGPPIAAYALRLSGEAGRGAAESGNGRSNKVGGGPASRYTESADADDDMPPRGGGHRMSAAPVPPKTAASAPPPDTVNAAATSAVLVAAEGAVGPTPESRSGARGG